MEPANGPHPGDIPAAIRAIRHQGFRNVFEYLALGRNPFPDPACPTVWGTETLAGDWNGSLLIVLKDFAPTLDLENRRDGKPLYSHRADFRTNMNLVAFLKAAGFALDLEGGACGSCGAVVASACYLLRVGTGRSGKRIPRQILEKSWPVLEFTLDHRPNLTDIVLCGVEAFSTFRDNGGLEGDRRAIQSTRVPVQWRGLSGALHYASAADGHQCSPRARRADFDRMADCRRGLASHWVPCSSLSNRPWKVIVSVAISQAVRRPISAGPWNSERIS